MKRVNVIGAGRIAGPVLRHLAAGGAWRLGAVLARRGRADGPGGLPVIDDADAFFGVAADLIVEAAGPGALALYGERALARADVWTISGTALADDALRERLERAGRRYGHRLRLLAGALAGLDGVAAAATDPEARVGLRVIRPEAEQAPGDGFDGSAREAAGRFPHEVNVAVALALAGAGLEATRVEMTSGPARRLAVTAESRTGSLSVTIDPRLDEATGAHPVAASIIAALEQETRTIWAG